MKRQVIVAILLAGICVFGVGCSAKIAEISTEEMASLTENKLEKESADDIRIMSSNVLVDIKSWGGEPVPDRANRLAIAIKQYMPDVVGAQEFNKTWYKKFPSMIADSGYELIKEKNSVFLENRSPIIYNSKTLKLNDHGIHKYSIGDNNGCRVASWAVFEKIDTKKVFAVISTHFNFVRSNDEKESLKIMNLQREELLAQSKTIEDRYHCPLFAVGDFNCMEQRAEYLTTEYYGDVSQAVAASDVYNKLCLDYTDAKYVNNINKFDVGGGLLPNGAWTSPTWDHIFFRGEASVKTFAVLSSVYFQRYENGDNRVSDHLPIFADFLLK
ncbi:MAG: endonuclease/exonuclease/phosphatase family protein [Clostridia bacterium]